MLVTTDLQKVWLFVWTGGLLLSCCTVYALWNFLSEYRRER